MRLDVGGECSEADDLNGIYNRKLNSYYVQLTHDTFSGMQFSIYIFID